MDVWRRIGYHVRKDSIARPTHETQLKEAPMHCPYCGKPVDDGIPYCPWCGGGLREDTSSPIPSAVQ